MRFGGNTNLYKDPLISRDCVRSETPSDRANVGLWPLCADRISFSYPRWTTWARSNRIDKVGWILDSYDPHPIKKLPHPLLGASNQMGTDYQKMVRVGTSGQQCGVHLHHKLMIGIT